jgi:hypothetical protein
MDRDIVWMALDCNKTAVGSRGSGISISGAKPSLPAGDFDNATANRDDDDDDDNASIPVEQQKNSRVNKNTSG